MFKKFFKKILRNRRRYEDINPEDIFLDSANLPGFEEHALEGRLEKPMRKETFLALKIILAVVALALVSKLYFLSVISGEIYAEISENNRLQVSLIFANRGVILDRNEVELAGNDIKTGNDFAGRRYAEFKGLAHAVGYLKYPLRDDAGVYYELNYQAKDGTELAFNAVLGGVNGRKLVETDVAGAVTSESIVEEPIDGRTVTLSIDAELTQALYNAIESLALKAGFVGGAGVIMDVETGEILALSSFPEYNQNALTRGIDQKSFDALLKSPRAPFLNRATGGLYTPGSIVKPIVALAALNERIISPDKEILSTGSITVENPYDPDKPSVFKDWKAHGYTNMSEALAVSSDTYFYAIGGGYKDQRGLGITLLDKYLTLFGLEEKTGIELPGELEGIIPNPEWKSDKFADDIWRLGDTYITAIGQFGTQITPVNAARFAAAIANKGKLLKPSLISGGQEEPVAGELHFAPEDWQVVHRGMRESVTYGTSLGLNVPYVEAAAKTGTAELGAGKTYVHSWTIGFFPYRKPKYAWAVIMEKAPAATAAGATAVMREVLDWMYWNRQEYLTP